MAKDELSASEKVSLELQKRKNELAKEQIKNEEKLTKAQKEELDLLYKNINLSEMTADNSKEHLKLFKNQLKQDKITQEQYNAALKKSTELILERNNEGKKKLNDLKKEKSLGQVIGEKIGLGGVFNAIKGFQDTAKIMNSNLNFGDKIRGLFQEGGRDAALEASETPITEGEKKITDAVSNVGNILAASLGFEQKKFGIEQENRKDDLSKMSPTESKEDVKTFNLMGVKEKDKKGLIGKLLTGLLFGAAGIGTLIAGMFDEGGPFKGLKKIIGKLLLRIGTGLIDNVIKTFAKFGDNIFKIVGKLFGKGSSKAVTKVVGKAGRKGLGKILSKLGGKLLKGGLKALKFVPIIGGIVSLWFAFQRFKAGDFIGGLLEIAAGLTDFIPVVGTAISTGLDVFLAFRDVKGGGAKKLGKSGGNKKVGDFFKKIGKWFKETGLKIYDGLKKLPVVGNLIQMVENFIKGKNKEGFLQLLLGISWMAPGAGALANWLLNPSYGGGSGRVKQLTQRGMTFFKNIGDFLGDVIGKIWTFIQEKISGPINWFKSLFNNQNEENDKPDENKMSKLVNAITNLGGVIIDGFIGIIDAMAERLKEPFQKIQNFIKSWVPKMPDWMIGIQSGKELENKGGRQLGSDESFNYWERDGKYFKVSKNNDAAMEIKQEEIPQQFASGGLVGGKGKPVLSWLGDKPEAGGREFVLDNKATEHFLLAAKKMENLSKYGNNNVMSTTESKSNNDNRVISNSGNKITHIYNETHKVNYAF
jgi:hypothetical protein